MIVIEMNDGGIIKLELDEKAAPRTVENFRQLVNRHFYDGLLFHRVIKGFMIQGGDPTGTGMGSSDRTIPGEFASNGFNNPLKHTAGVISMARSTDPDSASCQFFIMHRDAPHLDGGYAAFGKVVEGMEVVNRIACTPTDYRDRPLTPQVIRTIREE
ncbi:MAG: peptidylprolyl isomerase [Erysipelotrichaceae bacterium]|nr:peptidylprolyl isomerase [Erysipelotrichaceae bacterium]